MKSIKSKIMVAIIGIVTVSLLLVGGASILLNYNSTLSTLNQTLSTTAVVTAQQVSHELQGFLNVAYETGTIKELTDPRTNLEDKKAILDQRVENYGFREGNILSTDGLSLFGSDHYGDQPFFQNALNGKSSITEPIVDQTTGKVSVLIAAPLRKDGKTNGTVAGVVYYVPPDIFLNDIVSSINVSEKGYAYMLDKNGNTIAHPNMELIQIKSNTVDDAKSDPALNQLAALETAMTQGKSGFGMYSYGGVSKFLAYAPISDTDGWSVAVNAPISDFMSQTLAAIILTICMLVGANVVAVIIAVILAGKIGKPVKQAADRLALLAQGDLSSPVPTINTQDETALLMKDLKLTVDQMGGMIHDISYHMGEIARGNLSATMTYEYRGDFKPLEVCTRMIQAALNDTLGQINIGADQVAAGSDQVSCGAQALSQGATEQAAAVEELAATISEISQHVKNSAQNAGDASKKVDLLGDEIQNSNNQMERMIQAMNEISSSSSEIGKIIKTIEDIAFQTNILALNAAVEAARAGAAGKGFAVVADEVRNLASKSAQAANNTTALIESSIQSVKNGTMIAEETGVSLHRVIGETRMVVDVVAQISEAAQQQANSISQITTGIDQISSVVHTNSATAEQSAAASEELSSQAQNLKGLVGRFQLRPENRLTKSESILRETSQMELSDSKY